VKFAVSMAMLALVTAGNIQRLGEMKVRSNHQTSGEPLRRSLSAKSGDDMKLTTNAPGSYDGKVKKEGGDGVKNYGEAKFDTYPNCNQAGTTACTTMGTIYIEELHSGVTRMYGLLNDVTPGTNAADMGGTMLRCAHIHDNPPTMTNGGCSGNTLGDVFDGPNPGRGKDHQQVNTPVELNSERKLGDLGNINITASGSTKTPTAQFMLFNDAVKLDGADSVDGRAINIHIGTDDYNIGQYANDAAALKLSQAVGLGAAAADPSLLNAVGCAAIKKLDKPKVKATAHMTIDKTISAASTSGQKLDYTVTGTLTFEELEMPSGSNYATGLTSGNNHGTMTRITGQLKGLPDGMHGFHVHEMWTDGAPDCLHGTGYIYDPNNQADIPGGAQNFDPFSTPPVVPSATGMMMHGSPANAYGGTRLTGDMGNVITSKDGVSLVYIMDPELQVSGGSTIIGHSVDIHPNMDQLVGPLPDTDPTAPDPLDKVGDVPVACGEIKKGLPGLSTGEIAAVVIGVFVLAGAVVGGFMFFRKQQSPERASEMEGGDYKPPLLEVQTHGVGNSL